MNNVSALPCETWNAHRTRATLELLQFIPAQLWPPNSPDLNSVDNSMWEILQEKVYETGITDLELSKMPLINSCRNDDMAQLAWPSPFSVAVSVRSDQWCAFSTSSLAMPIVSIAVNQLHLNLEFGGHSWGGVDTLFSWGGKRLHSFAANLFRKRCARFH